MAKNRFDPDSIRASIDLAEVISSYGVELKQNGNELTGCCPFHDERTPSFSVVPHKHFFHCFGCGESGDVIDFVVKITGADFKAACKALGAKEMIDGQPMKKLPKREVVDAYADYAPASTGNIIEVNKPIALMNPKRDHKVWKGSKAEAVYPYLNAAGEVFGYVLRHMIEGKKQTPQVRWCTGPNGWEGWTRFDFGANRMPYNLPDILNNPGKQVLIVEGEKAADHGKAAIDGKMVVASWCGGTNGIEKTDWGSLKGRKVILLPDRDDGGLKAMRWLADHLKSLGAESVRFIMAPAELAKGWDIADYQWEDHKALIGWLKAHEVDFLPENYVLAELDADPDADDNVVPDDYDSSFTEHHDSSGDDGEETDEPVDAVPAALDIIKPLGHDHGTFYYWSASQQQITSLPASSHKKLYFLQLAPLDWWEDNFYGKSGPDWDQAANSLMRQCENKGIYDPSKIRGRGCWRDNGEVVVHLGDRVATSGGEVHVATFKSNYIYEAARHMRGPHSDALSDNDAKHLLDTSKLFSWEKPASAALLCGWVVFAPLCGAMKWRPHIWLTGGTGTGKSTIMDEFIKPLLAGMDLYVQGNSTEAGIRQTLGSDAMPVLFDEAEQNNEAEMRRVQSILALARQASSDGQARTVKGTAGGNAMNFLVRSMFCMASIQVGIKQQADHTRIAVLGLRRSGDIDAWEQTKASILRINSDEDYGRRLVKRTIDNFGTTMANVKTFINAAARYFGNQRLGDQFGTLLAGSYSLASTELVTPGQAMAFIEGFSWDEYTDEATEDESITALQSILQVTTRVDHSSGGEQMALGEMISLVAGHPSNSLASVADCNAVLSRFGVKVMPHEGTSGVFIANKSDLLERSLRDKPWGMDWKNYLKRVDGSIATKKPMRFGAGIVSRAVFLSLKSLLG